MSAYNSNTADSILSNCTDPRVPYRISGSDVSLFLESPFSLYCKHFVDRSERDPPDPSQALFTEYGHNHESRIMRERYPGEVPPYTQTTLSVMPQRGRRPTRQGGNRSRKWVSPQEHAVWLDKSRVREFEKTLEMMHGGAETLLEPQLCFFPRGMHGSPDILERCDGVSLLGDHHYVVKEIKSSRKIKRKHIMQAAFYNIMLGEIQGVLPEIFYLLNAEGVDASYEHEKYAESIEAAVSGVVQIKEGMMPSVWYGRGMFPWSNYSDKMAVERDDLSLISGMDQKSKRVLIDEGIETVAALLAAGLPTLEGLGLSSDDAARYLARAEAIRSGIPMGLGQPCRIRTTDAEMFLRVEETMNGEVYMIGALIRTGSTRDHHTFVSLGLDGEARMLKEFLEMVGGLPRHVAYYWGSGEAVIARLAKKHLDGELPQMRMADLQQMAAALVAFPTYRDKLKMVAEWMGFGWRDPYADWGRAATAYRKYVEDNSRLDCLRYITQYSEDNCAAVELVWDWLIKHRHILPEP